MTPVTAGGARVRLVVLGVLWLDVAGVVTLAALLSRPAGIGAGVLLAAVLAAHAVAHGLALRAAVSPWVEQRARDLLGAALVVATALACPVLAASAVPREEPWAWVLGFSVGALVVLRRSIAGVTAVLGALALALGVAGSVRDGLVFAALSALLAGGLTLLVVWMLRVLVSAEEGREAQARLAVADERWRVARDLHDVLSHRLSVLALRAELAGDRESQELANRTLHDVRAAVHDVGTLDVGEQIAGAALVLRSAGIAVEVSTGEVGAGPARMGAAASQLLGAAVREAVTNVLRHSEARRCRIRLGHHGDVARLVVDNDGARAGHDPAGTGLAGLAERARPLGARVHAEHDGSAFTLRVDVPVAGPVDGPR